MECASFKSEVVSLKNRYYIEIMKKVFPFILTFLIIGWLWYLTLPTIRFGFTGVPFLLFLSGILLHLLTRSYPTKKRYRPQGGDGSVGDPSAELVGEIDVVPVAAL